MSATHQPAVSARQLHKGFVKRRPLSALLRHPFRRGERIRALNGVDLEVMPGEIFGLLGPNGAGKTTLLKILSGLVLPDSGEGRVNGASIFTQEMTVRRSIGYVTSDERSFYWRLSGRQNLLFFARLFHLPTAGLQARVDDLLQRVDLAEKASQPFSGYSSGMKQRLAIARALLHDPPVLFLDEPTRSLDPVTARHMRTFIRDHLSADDGKTILLATHNLHEAASLCHRMAILSHGRVRRTGRLDEFRALFAAHRCYRLELDRPVPLDGVCRMVEGGAAVTGTGKEPAAPFSALVELHEDSGAGLTRLVRHLAASGATVLEMSRQEPPLEDLFDRLFSEPAGEER